MTSRRVVILGGGATGFQVAQGLRQRGFDGLLTMVEPEVGLPYDRPPLSKQFLVGTWEESRVRLRSREDFDALGIDHLQQVSAVSLDVDARRVTLSDGQVVAYDDLVVATGASPVLPEAWRVSPRVMTFRRLEDAAALASHLGAGSSVAVIGAGMIGSEIASSARSLGLEVTLIDASSTPLAPLLGDDLAARLMAAHREHGVRVLTGARVERLDAPSEDAVAVSVTREDGAAETIEADVVVVAVGVRPETSWLTGSGLRLADGVVCDEACRAAPGVHAGGDVALVRHAFFDATLRFEQRTMSTEHARVIADGIVGTDTSVEAVPYYWSDQHHRRLQGCGLVASQVHQVDTLEIGDAMVALFVEDGIVRGAAVHRGPKLFPHLLKAIKGRSGAAELRASLGAPVAMGSA